MEIKLIPRGKVVESHNRWRMEIPEGLSGAYRLAQLDDYAHLSRRRFPHFPPQTFSLRARVSAEDLPGTWGFGLWNDPFGLSLGFGGTASRLPAFPQAAWFFHGSRDNYLSLRDDIPGNGFFAGTFRSPILPSLLTAPIALFLPMLSIHSCSRRLRQWASKYILQDSVPVFVNVTEWHEYKIGWQSNSCTFYVDTELLAEIPISPSGSLGLVIWIDNQYAAWDPEGRLIFGTMKNPAAWMEIEDLEIN